MIYTPEQPTLRDRFAMAALPGFIARLPNKAVDLDDVIAERAHQATVAAQLSYEFADAMLAARSASAKNGGEGE